MLAPKKFGGQPAGGKIFSPPKGGHPPLGDFSFTLFLSGNSGEPFLGGRRFPQGEKVGTTHNFLRFHQTAIRKIPYFPPPEPPNQNLVGTFVVTRAGPKSKIKGLSSGQDATEIVEEGQRNLTSKIHQFKLKFNDTTINNLVNFFNLKTSKDLFYNVGAGIIDNKMLKNFASARSNVLFDFFKKKLRRKPSGFQVVQDDGYH